MLLRITLWLGLALPLTPALADDTTWQNVAQKLRQHDPRAAVTFLQSQPRWPDNFWKMVPSLLQDKDPMVILEMTIALRKQAGLPETVRAALLRQLDHRDAHVREHVIIALNSQGAWPQAFWNAVPKLLNDPSYLVRQQIIASVESQTGWEEKLKKVGGKIYRLKDYVSECETAGIEIPTRLSCDDAQEIPIIAPVCDPMNRPDTVPVTNENYEEVRKRQGLSELKCNQPAHLQVVNNPCAPGSRMKVMKSRDQKSFCVMACRKYERDYQPKQKNEFQDINMICHRPESGASCFFNSQLGETLNGSKIPKPGSAEGENFWSDAQVYDRDGFSCLKCHDNDPIIRTPYSEKLAGLTPENLGYRPKGPYYAVGSGVPLRGWKDLYYFREKNACTGCHRIGSQASCGWLSKQMHDKYPEPMISEPEAKKICFSGPYPAMPPHSEDYSPEQRAQFKADYERLSYCCQHLPPQAKDCQWAPIPEGSSPTGETRSLAKGGAPGTIGGAGATHLPGNPIANPPPPRGEEKALESSPPKN